MGRIDVLQFQWFLIGDAPNILFWMIFIVSFSEDMSLAFKLLKYWPGFNGALYRVHRNRSVCSKRRNAKDMLFTEILGFGQLHAPIIILSKGILLDFESTSLEQPIAPSDIIRPGFNGALCRVHRNRSVCSKRRNAEDMLFTAKGSS